MIITKRRIKNQPIHKMDGLLFSRKSEVFILSGEEGHCCGFGFRNCDHEQASPAQFTVLCDAGLEGEVAIAKVHSFEHILSGEGFILAQVAERAVGAVGLQSLILENFGNYEIFDAAIAVDQADLLPNFELEERSAREMVVRQKTDVSKL